MFMFVVNFVPSSRVGLLSYRIVLLRPQYLFHALYFFIHYIKNKRRLVLYKNTEFLRITEGIKKYNLS